MYFKGVCLVFFITYATSMPTALAEDLICGNKGKPCDPNWFCDGTRCNQCKYVTSYCFKDAMPAPCLGFCRIHRENEIRKDEEIKCELKLKNLTETFEGANNLTTYLPNVLNNATDYQSEGNSKEHSGTWFIISISLATAYLLTCSLSIIYIIHLRQIIAHSNINRIADTEADPFIPNNNYNNNNNNNDGIDHGAAGNTTANGANPIAGIQDNQPHCPENGILLDALQN